MTQQSYTYDQLSKAFRQYLAERFDGDTEEVNLTVETAEHIIPNTLNDYFGTHLESIYDLQDSNKIKDFCMKIKTHPILKGLDMSEEPRYTEVLRWYRLFVKALYSDNIPAPVPGEYGAVEDTEQATVASDGQTYPKQQTTIFTEGEEGAAITAEHRKRNMELRRACIEIFRQKHRGHVVCECCGFDFAIAYDIKDEYIEVHHRFPFAHTEGEHTVNAETDLVPLCANCHRMIHHSQGGKGRCMSLDELKQIYRGKTYKDR